MSGLLIVSFLTAVVVVADGTFLSGGNAVPVALASVAHQAGTSWNLSAMLTLHNVKAVSENLLLIVAMRMVVDWWTLSSHLAVDS